MTIPAIDRRQWFVTAHTVRSRSINGRMVDYPGSTAHAKQMGTLLTACGVWAYSWRKIYDLHFPLTSPWSSAVDSCPECLQVVLAERLRPL